MVSAKKVIAASAVMLLALLITTTLAEAEVLPNLGDPPVMGPGEFFQRWWDIAQADTIVGLERGTCSILWDFDRLALLIYGKVVQQGMTRDVREAMLDAVANLMPSVLRNVLFGGSGGGAGLMYIALMLAGLAMAAVPLLGGGMALVRLDRVLTWGVLITALFISTGMGYDFINLLEDVRVGMMNSVSQSSTVTLHNLVTQPMMARPDEALVNLFSFVLPEDFEKTYFPKPQTQLYRVVLIDVKLGAVAEDTPVETEESIANRKAQAAAGVVMALFSALGGVLVLMFAIVYGLLDLAALVTLLFLFAALPLGFFEFGTKVLGDTLSRYVQIAIVGLVVAIFMAISSVLIHHILSNANDSRTLGVAALYILLTVAILKAALSRAMGLLMEAGKGVSVSTKAVLGASSIVAVRSGVAVPGRAQLSASQIADKHRSAMKRAVGAAVVGGARGFIGGGGYAGAARGAVKGVSRALKDERKRGNVFLKNGRG